MKKIIDFLLHGEGIKLKAYDDNGKAAGGTWTIGIGNTFYKDGRPVRQGDVITKEAAFELAEFVALDFATHVKKCLKRPVTENQFIALVSFCYNIGKARFAESIILKMVNVNSNDPAIKTMFPKSFITQEGKFNQGLVNRRLSEAKRYFTL